MTAVGRRRLGAVATVSLAMAGSLLALPASSVAAATDGAVITSPTPLESELPGGWTGPVAVDLSGVPAGAYAMEVRCGGGHREVLHFDTTPVEPADPGEDPGATPTVFTSPIAALPQRRHCLFALKDPAEDPDDVAAWLSQRDVYVTSNTFTFDDLDLSGPEFFPAPDGYRDQQSVTYWLTQPATVTAEVVASGGKVVRRMQTRHYFEGESRTKWDGRTGRGEPAAEGRYRLRLTAHGMNGDQVRQSTSSFWLVRQLRARPGFVDDARGGMSVTRAMRTGQFRRDVRHRGPGCTRVYPLQAKQPHAWHYSVFVRRGRITEMTATDLRAFSLPRSLDASSRVRDVRSAFPNAIRGTAGYGNHALFVRSGRAWMVYFFRSYSYERKMRASDRLQGVSVSYNRRPIGATDDGC